MSPNTNIKLGDIVNVNIPSTISTYYDALTNIDSVNSGKYMVGGIMISVQKDGYYNMVLTLFRNGVNKSNDEGITFEMLKAGL